MFKNYKNAFLAISSLVVVFGLVLLSGGDALAAEVQVPTQTMQQEIPSDLVILTDENGNVIDSSEFQVFEEVTRARGQIISRNYTMYQSNYFGIFHNSIYVSFASGYLKPWSGYVYYRSSSSASTWSGTVYTAKYTGTLYSEIR